MKLLRVLGVLLICSVATLAQSVPDAVTAPGVLITKPNFTIKLQQYVVRGRESLPDELRRASTLPLPTDNNANVGVHSTGTSSQTKTRFLFLYSAKVKNVGAKKIEGLLWDYVFIRVADDTELGRLRLVNRSSIKPDKSELISTLTSERPPITQASRVVHVNDLERKTPPYTERVEIKCIAYADGTTWRDPKLSAGDCEGLVKVKRRKRG